MGFFCFSYCLATGNFKEGTESSARCGDRPAPGVVAIRHAADAVLVAVSTIRAAMTDPCRLASSSLVVAVQAVEFLGGDEKFYTE